MKSLILFAILGLAFAAPRTDRVFTDFQSCQATLMGKTFDFSSLAGMDIKWDDYWLAWCGGVTRSYRCSGSDVPSLCYAPDYTTSKSLSTWSTLGSKIEWMLQKPGDINSGLYVVFPNSTAYPYLVRLIIDCVHGQLTSFESRGIETKGNEYWVHIASERACPDAPQPFQACTYYRGGYKWDLSPMAGKSVHFVNGSRTYYMTWCGYLPDACTAEYNYPAVCSEAGDMVYATWSSFGSPITYAQLDPYDPMAGLTITFPPNKMYPWGVKVNMGCSQTPTYITSMEIQPSNQQLLIWGESPLACPVYTGK